MTFHIMINPSHLANVQADSKIFLQSKPFNHVVLDHFIGDAGLIDSVVRELHAIPDENYQTNDPNNLTQVYKRWLSDIERFPPDAQSLLLFLQSPDFLRYLEQLTGIADLIPDPSLLGGGIHKSSRGGHLSVHADFNIHETTGFHRRINVLLYLNPEWKDEWKGKLELWDSKMTRIEKEVSPILNRMVIFRITDDAFHGHPVPLACPDDIARYSFALYYYTVDRPENEKSPFHWATWQRRPDGTY